jgi:hypothetical protein
MPVPICLRWCQIGPEGLGQAPPEWVKRWGGLNGWARVAAAVEAKRRRGGTTKGGFHRVAKKRRPPLGASDCRLHFCANRPRRPEGRPVLIFAGEISSGLEDGTRSRQQSILDNCSGRCAAQAISPIGRESGIRTGRRTRTSRQRSRQPVRADTNQRSTSPREGPRKCARLLTQWKCLTSSFFGNALACATHPYPRSRQR